MEQQLTVLPVMWVATSATINVFAHQATIWMRRSVRAAILAAKLVIHQPVSVHRVIVLVGQFYLVLLVFALSIHSSWHWYALIATGVVWTAHQAAIIPVWTAILHCCEPITRLHHLVLAIQVTMIVDLRNARSVAYLALLAMGHRFWTVRVV